MQSIFLYIIVGIVCILMIVFLLSPSYAKKAEVTIQGPYNLDETTEILTSDLISPFYKLGQASFQGFLYLNPIKKTGSYSSCGVNPNDKHCEDGSKGPCQCASDTGDCSMCTHNGYLNILTLAGIVGLEILLVPDAGRQDSAMVQLTVKTETVPLSGSKTTLSQKYIETMVLPPIPYQKWVMVTIAREGRRFDIYYNDSLVLSQKTMNMPISKTMDTNGKGLTSGTNGLVGILSSITMYTNRQSSVDVDNAYSRLADTRGKPYGLPSSVDKPTQAGSLGIIPVNSLPSFPTLSWCIFGACKDETNIQPANPLYNWTSPYA